MYFFENYLTLMPGYTTVHNQLSLASIPHLQDYPDYKHIYHCHLLRSIVGVAMRASERSLSQSVVVHHGSEGIGHQILDRNHGGWHGPWRWHFRVYPRGSMQCCFYLACYFMCNKHMNQNLPNRIWKVCTLSLV